MWDLVGCHCHLTPSLGSIKGGLFACGVGVSYFGLDADSWIVRQDYFNVGLLWSGGIIALASPDPCAQSGLGLQYDYDHLTPMFDTYVRHLCLPMFHTYL